MLVAPVAVGMWIVAAVEEVVVLALEIVSLAGDFAAALVPALAALPAVHYYY